MSTRDRLMLFGIALLAVLGGAWILAVSPARQKASKAAGEVSSARAQLVQAQSELAEARTAQLRYRTAYGQLASLGQAVPTSPEVPSLVYALDQASSRHQVQFSSVTAGGSGSGSGSSGSGSGGSSASGGASAGANGAAAAAPFTQMPFTFTFTGGYSDLIHLLTQLEGFTVQTTTGGKLRVSGRLLTIQSIQLNPPGTSANAASSHASEQMSWTIDASAYVLAPTAPSAAGGASGAGASGSAPAATTTGAGSAGATPAVIRANG